MPLYRSRRGEVYEPVSGVGIREIRNLKLDGLAGIEG